MDSKRNEQRQVEEPGLFSTAVSEETLDVARRRICSRLLVAPGQSGPQGSLVVQSRAAEHYMRGTLALEQSECEKAIICFCKAAALQPQQTRVYEAQAEAYLQLCDFQSAAACYNKARLLEPGAFSGRLALIYYLQGQCLFDRRLYSEALEAFGGAAALRRGWRASTLRSLACLSAAGRLTDCLNTLNDWMLSDAPTSDLYILRARLHRQLHRTSQCYRDVQLALALKPECPAARALLQQLQAAGEQARRRAVDAAVSGQLPEALSMINGALERCPQDARLYLLRGTLYRRLKDFTAAIEDLVQALELREGRGEEEVKGQAEFQLVLTYNDFAVQCFSGGLYDHATLLLDHAIEQEKSQAGLYLNRGDCFFKQGVWSYALADYQQAEEMLRPDDPAVRLRLAVLHHTLGSLHFQDGRFQEAADMFSVAIQYDPSVSQYYESRSRSFRKLQNVEAARRDVICTLILDRSSEEPPAELMSLFPGHSVSDVLSSPAGRSVRAQLMDTVQACSSSSEQQRLSEMLQQMTLTNGNAAVQSHDPREARAELMLCVNQHTDMITVKHLLQGLMGKQRQTPPVTTGGGANDSRRLSNWTQKE